MSAITLFEVHVYQNDRWSIHARYPSSDREEAVRDASATEGVTGFPTKVVRETYFPGSNNTETVTTYLSPKAKVLRARAGFSKKVPPKAISGRAVNAPQTKQAPPARQRLSVRNVLFRVVVAAAIALATTALIVGVLAWMLRRFAEVGVPLSGAMTSTILTYGYIVVFIFSFASLFRSRLPLHHLLAKLWTSARLENEAERVRSHMKSLPKLKPKHELPSSPEYLREWEEMKIRRGDLDAAAPPKSVDSEIKATRVTPAEDKTPELAPEAKEDAKEKDKQGTDALHDSVAEESTLEVPPTLKLAISEASQPRIYEHEDQKTPLPATDDTGNDDALKLEGHKFFAALPMTSSGLQRMPCRMTR